MNSHYPTLAKIAAPGIKLLVDDKCSKTVCGRTRDLSKFEYNLNVFDDEFKMAIKLHIALAVGGMMRVESIGRFITIIEINKDETDACMVFCDFKTPFSRESLLEVYPEDIVEQFFDMKRYLDQHFSITDDKVVLFKP